MHLRNRKVTSLRTGGDRIYISAGLADGDLVSLTSLDASFAGVKAEIMSSIPSDQLYNSSGQIQAQPTERLETGTAAAARDGAMAGGG